MHEPERTPVSSYRTSPSPLEHKKPLSFLLLGIDKRETDTGRADTIIVVTVNPNDKSTKMISIPRDTYAEIIGLQKKDKINHSYAFGGMDMVKVTVENLLQIPIDYTISINMEGFIDLVDTVNGVDIDNTLAFEMDNHLYKLGHIHLEGVQTLAYVRMRYQDPHGDFGRQERQKIVLRAIYEKLKTFNSVWNYKELLAVLGDHVRTNLTFDDMKTISSDYKDALSQVDSITLQKGNGQMLDNIWYFMLDVEELNQINIQLKNHLELTK